MSESSQLTQEQRDGSACSGVGCGTTEPPLHPGKTIEIRDVPGVVRDVVTVICTACLLAGRE
jgi:hypothetical protein